MRRSKLGMNEEFKIDKLISKLEAYRDSYSFISVIIHRYEIEKMLAESK